MMSTQSLLKPSPGLHTAFKRSPKLPARSRPVAPRAEVKRSFNEEDGKVSGGGDKKQPLYADDAAVTTRREFACHHASDAGGP